MDDIVHVTALSPFPTVVQANVKPPSDGLFVAAPRACSRAFFKDEACRRHYELLFTTSAASGKLVQCPHGFSSFLVSGKVVCFAFTCLVPYPRQGGSAERLVAKQHPMNKVSLESLVLASRVLTDADAHLRRIELETVQNYAKALHEIRKLNATVKRTAERLCSAKSPEDPDMAPAELVRIWKTSELMSAQFEILEVLAQEHLTTLPLNTATELYRLVDKCVRIYSTPNQPKRIRLKGTKDARRVMGCDKTLPIIPTVLIANALKYSPPNTDVWVTLRQNGDDCVLDVTNYLLPEAKLDDSVFLRGVRAASDSEGSGNGLYVAQLVAKQHGTVITVRTDVEAQNRRTGTFSVQFRSDPIDSASAKSK